jgi:two-component system sensor kinase FixL
MGQMAVSLAHEINQPLGAIASYAHGCRNWLASNVYERERVLEAIERIASEALRAGEITRRLRDLLRKGRPRRESASLKSMVENAVGIAQPAAQSAEVALHFDVAGDLPRLTVDPIQIEQVLLNLLLNAIDAAPGSERARAVHVGARREAEGVMVSVSDTGSGIDPEIEQKLFEPFFTTKPNGLGMGLVISRSIVEAHGGRIWVESAVEGGARFCFTLPLSGREE